MTCSSLVEPEEEEEEEQMRGERGGRRRRRRKRIHCFQTLTLGIYLACFAFLEKMVTRRWRLKAR
jgi:hypothetical protein